MAGYIIDDSGNKAEIVDVQARADAKLGAMYAKGASPKSYNSNIGIMCLGQSNMDGRCPSTDLPSNITLPLENALVCNNYNGTFASLSEDYFSSGSKWAFDTIAFYYTSSVDGNTLYAVKHAVGGTSIDPTGSDSRHWTAEYEGIRAVNRNSSLLYNAETKLRKAMSVNSNLSIRCVLWNQGEGDAAIHSATAAANYYDNLRNLIAYVRGVVGDQRLPFICTTVSHNSQEYDATVEAAVKRIASEDPNVYVVDMKNAVLLDAYHPNAVWTEYLGKKVHDLMIDIGIFTGTKLNPSEPT